MMPCDIVSRCAQGRDADRAMPGLKLLLLLCLRGNPFVYYGEELGCTTPRCRLNGCSIRKRSATGPKPSAATGHEHRWHGTRKAIAGFGSAEPWLPIDPRHLSQSVAAQEADVNRCCTLPGGPSPCAAIRGLAAGRFHLIMADENLLIFTRSRGDEKLLCLFNLGHETGHFLLPAGCEEIAALGSPSPGSGAWPVLSAYVGRI